ncbi:9694_t:CDS:2 [Funneliformis geosporum]|uniref:9694_t:CDS:1 n=1 Tax=Funneliformis geosporum TaxID=1117311 RepID=A0A9W4T0R2_9GLOM|nr:9694_t:CDS:2 [Funneliformis geosporum]
MLRTVKQIKKAIDKENKKNKRVDGVGKVKIGKPNGQSLTFGEFLTALKNKNVGTNKIFRKSFMVYKPGDLLEEFEPQPEVYQKYYDKELTKSVVSFPSLSKNLLVVPKPTEVAEQMLAKLAANPKVPYYLSTSGLQVIAADNELFFDNTDPSPEVKEKVERLSQMGKKTDKVVERIKKRIENEEDSSRPTFWGTPLEGMTYEKVNACFKRNQKISEDKFNVVAKNPLSVLLYHPEKNLELAREHLDLNHERLLDKLDNLKRKDMDEGAVLEPEKKINFADYSSALIKDTFNTIRYTNWEQVKKYAELELLKKDIKLEEFTKIFSENQIEESSLTGKFKNLWDLNRLFNCEKKGSDINCVAEVIEKDGDLVLTSLHSGQILRKLYDEEKFPVGERVIDWNAAIPQNGVLYRLLYNNLTELKKLAKQKGLKLSEAETEKDTNHTPTFAEHTSEEKIELAAESVKEFAKWARELLTITRITEAELNGGIEDKMEEDFDSLDGKSREREAADLIKVTEYLLNKKRNYVLECTEKKGNLIQFRVIESTDRNEEEIFDKAERKIINILNSEGDPTEIELNDISPAD